MARRKTRTVGEKRYDGNINNRYYNLTDRELSQQCKSTCTFLWETFLFWFWFWCLLYFQASWWRCWLLNVCVTTYSQSKHTFVQLKSGYSGRADSVERERGGLRLRLSVVNTPAADTGTVRLGSAPTSLPPPVISQQPHQQPAPASFLLIFLLLLLSVEI